MPRKPSSHFVAHVVTAFVNRLSQAIHEIAVARAHSEMLGALGGVRTPAKGSGKARGPTERTKATKKAATKAAKTLEKTGAKTASKAAARTATKTASKAATKTMTTAKAKPRASAKAKLAAARPAAVATRSQGKRKSGVVSSLARMPAVKPAAAAPAPAVQAALSERPPVPPGSVLASETAAPASVG